MVRNVDTNLNSLKKMFGGVNLHKVEYLDRFKHVLYPFGLIYVGMNYNVKFVEKTQ
jgi:hypothetical protein